MTIIIKYYNIHLWLHQEETSEEEQAEILILNIIIAITLHIPKVIVKMTLEISLNHLLILHQEKEIIQIT